MPSLTPKTNVLGYFNAYHLLRRTTYNITKARINYYATKTPDQALTELFTFSAPSPPSPLNNLGETIVPTIANPTITDTQNTVNVVYDNYWWMYNALKDVSAQHKITYWLHLLFVTDNDASFFTNYDYKELLRFHTNGSLKDLAVRITTNPRMLIYLNNNVNTKNSPNQNYAREFLELFTILKGPQIATGNYTNYTETDVQQAAKVLSGFTLTSANQLNLNNRLNLVDPVTNLPKGFVNINNHDINNKTFSSAFGSAVITGGNTVANAEAELVSFVNMVFNQDETAKGYCRRMYRYFVGRNITTAIENDIIVPLASTLKANGYQILPVLKTLLSSKHFYDEEDTITADQILGSLVKSPLELYFQMFSLLNLTTPTYSANSSSMHSFMSIFASYSQNAGMPVFRPQSVNGYAGYSSSPHYDKNFITTASLRIRYYNSIDLLINGTTQGGFLYKLNLPLFVKDGGAFQNPANGDLLVSDFCELLFVDIPPADRLSYFKNIFLGGLSLINWQNEWNNYVNTGVATNVKIPIDRLVKALVKSPEFQVM